MNFFIPEGYLTSLCFVLLPCSLLYCVSEEFVNITWYTTFLIHLHLNFISD